jgi:hypothetical protein
VTGEDDIARFNSRRYNDLSMCEIHAIDGQATVKVTVGQDIWGSYWHDYIRRRTSEDFYVFVKLLQFFCIDFFHCDAVYMIFSDLRILLNPNPNGF